DVPRPEKKVPSESQTPKGRSLRHPADGGVNPPLHQVFRKQKGRENHIPALRLAAYRLLLTAYCS
ncbi:MAG TPA: hypothetical protein VEN79_03445, partial [Terriglobia bacterium]|nr:hypothetical protein [Terriglobia bacterium]